MEECSREQIVKEQYLKLLQKGNAELSLLMTRCLHPLPKEGRVGTDLLRLEQELVLHQYLQNQGEWSALALAIPLCLAQSNPDGFLEIGEKISSFLNLDEVSLKWGIFLLSRLVLWGAVTKEDVVGCDWVMRARQENLQFQRMRIKALSSSLEFWEQILEVFQDTSSFGKELLEIFLRKEDSLKEEEHALGSGSWEGEASLKKTKEHALCEANPSSFKCNHYLPMAEYLWKVRNFKIKREPFTGSLQMERLFLEEEGQKGFLSVLGEYVISERRAEEGKVFLGLQTRRGNVRLQWNERQ